MCLLLLADLGFIDALDPRFVATVEAIGTQLRRGTSLFRYIAPDDFGHPETSFTICSFWYIDVLAMQGRVDEAKAMFERLIGLANGVGLLAEEYDPIAKRMLGNFPQAFSHVAMINSAFTLARALKGEEPRPSTVPASQRVPA